MEVKMNGESKIGAHKGGLYKGGLLIGWPLNIDRYFHCT